MMRPSSDTSAPRVVVVGGGLAGWMSAAYLRRVLRRLGSPVTLVAGAGTPAPGALATRPVFTRFLRGFAIDEAIFMRHCGATYALANRYDDWFEAGAGHWHPYGECGPRIDGLDIFHPWLKERLEGGAAGPYADYAPQTHMAAAGLGPAPETGGSSVTEAGSYGYHLDRAALVRFFREIALSEGVRAVAGRAVSAETGPLGDVAALAVEGGARVAGDIFVDCSGEAAFLIGGTLGETWIEDPAAGACDRLASVSRPPDPARPSFAAYAGTREGWTQRLPLAGRTEMALAYRAELTSREDAEAALRGLAGAGPDGAIRHRVLRAGRRRAPWLRNVVGIGGSVRESGPLGGFEADLILCALEAFVEHLPRGEGVAILRQGYARRMADLADEASGAVALHFALGRRPEPFWAAVRRAPLPDALADRLDLYEIAGRVAVPEARLFGESDHYRLLAGADLLPRRAFAPVDLADPRGLGTFLAGIRARAEQLAGTMAPHTLLLERLHGPVETSRPDARLAPASRAATGPAALRRTPEGARLADLVAALGQPFGYERSVKASAGTLQADRFLMSLHRTSLGPEPGPVLEGLAAKLGLGPAERAEAAALIAEADLLHLGYEDGPSGPLYKLYVEWSARTDAAWAREDEGEGEPLLVHRAYKWDPLRPGPAIVTLYHWPRVRGPDEIAARLARIGAGEAGWGEAGPRVLGVAQALLGLARASGRGAPHYLEASEAPGPRLSYDLNLYACGLTVGAAEALLLPAFADLGIPGAEAATILAERRDEALGHVAGGVGRDGRPFLTLYSGVAAGSER
ncbi:tryptophan 7-halogenase [Methylobacterium durans]|uniref:tryptophan 7-halogenase n=1 Tax=Methylobacterium durans TaxID=2202825 RepID=UPI002AFDE987|nr:tryptophan 7-halogenase [Methylobacterium durans]MEA1831389.1 tryptophan 7-halogenase [Methylobacterium durans]